MNDTALTRDVKETILARGQADLKFRRASRPLLANDTDVGKAILRDYIKATIGFEQLGAEIGPSLKSGWGRRAGRI